MVGKIKDIMARYHVKWGGQSTIEHDVKGNIYMITFSDRTNPISRQMADAWLTEQFAPLTQEYSEGAIVRQRCSDKHVHGYARPQCG